MTELTTYQQPADQSVDLHRPDLQQWAQNLEAAHRIGSALCATSFAPAHFRGKPAEAAAAILYGSEVGFTPTQALQNLYVIGGKPALYARPMVAIVQAHGHKVWTESKTDDAVTVCGQRKGSDTVERETWTVARAQRAGYTSNKKYQTDPQAMLYARAASDVCRRVAADALAGMVYSVEELELTQPDEPQARVKQAGADALRAAIGKPAEHPVPSDLEEPTPPPGEDVQDAEVVDEPVDPRLTRRMFAAFTAAGFTEDARSEAGRTRRLTYISQIVGRDIASSKELTGPEVAKVVDALEQDAQEQQ
jgi:hypothetical protein